ncbi:hypothetical protein Hanom_Chr16g01452751 [Helianthus anomalus]
MTASLKKRDEERMKKNVDELVDDLKKAAEEEKVENVKTEEVVTEEQQNEDDMKNKEEVDEKLERSVEVDDVDVVGEEQQKRS